MNSYPKIHIAARRLLGAALTACLALPLPALAASVALATSPLATTTTSSVKPNVVFVLDNSGSMAWEHLPDDATDPGSSVTFSYGYYGLRSSQCNEVYYNPSITYTAPVYANGTSYANATFTAAWLDGYNTGSGSTNLNTGFKAAASDSLGQPAYYYTYSGAQTTTTQKDYNSTTNTFYTECHNSTGGSVSALAPVSGVGGVFTKARLATTETTTISVSGSSSTTVSSITVNGVQLMSGTSSSSSTSSTVATNIAAKITLNGFSATASGSTVTITGPTSAANYTPVITQSGSMSLTPDVFPDTTAAKLTNFANWYSYYRTRMNMMKTSAGLAFKTINKNYRVGFMAMNSSASFLNVDTFWDNSDTSLGAVSSQKTNWYAKLYASTPSGSTPLRTALANAGLLYAHKLSLSGVTVNDPIQYSCQQNFTILSTDGFWNAGDGYQLDGSTLAGNQDGGAGRPMYDGATANTTVTTTYTRNTYSSSGTGIGSDSNCSSGKKRLKLQPQIETCSVITTGGVAGAENCGSGWSSNGSATYVSPYTSSTSTCTSSTITVPASTARAQSGSPLTVAGYTGGTSDTLADIAMYYYQTDLRTPALSNCTGATGNTICSTPAVASDPDPYNNVFISSADNNTQQHMTTFTLGLGATGRMKYTSSYATDTLAGNPGSDYLAIKLGSTAAPSATPPICSWQSAGTICGWPVPGLNGSDGKIENIDDLWHAAVNGHGTYFSATDPTSLSSGLSSALAGINALQGSAAAAATSTLNPVAGNNFSYVASYTTVSWKGNLEARSINIVTGVVDETASWCVENTVTGACPSPGTIVADTSGSSTIYNCVTPSSSSCPDGVLVGTDCKVEVPVACSGTMPSKVSATTDTRTIYTANSSGASLISFDATYAAANPTNFAAAHINTLSQWATLSAAQQTAAAGVNLINYLRGQNGYEIRDSNASSNRLYRYREAVLGDALESQPAYISSPVFSYPYTGYSDYKTAQAGRAGTVYMGTNDGMLHAFASANGVERWAYVPSMVIPNMWKLADTGYSTAHANYVNGSPIISDVYCTANCGGPGGLPSWRTILIGGLNGGGRGYYALDITVPNTPTLMWEFKPSTDSDLGYSFGQAIITQKQDGTWVVLVTSGYDNGTLSSDPAVSNSPAGSGQGYLYVLNAYSGAIISKIGTGVGTAATPSGLAKIAAWNDEPVGNKAGYVYGGDLLGNVWRFNINTAGAPFLLATLKDPANVVQPITTTPTLGKISDIRTIYIGTGKYLESADLASTQVQSMYALKDNNATTTLINPGGSPRNSTTLVKQTLTSAGATRTTSNNSVNYGTGQGWYVDFPDSKERVNIDSKLVQGTLIVPTIVPSNTDCSPGGYGWLNFFDFKTGAAINTTTGLASLKYDHTIVGVNVLYIAGSPIVEIVTDNQPTPDINSSVAFAAAAAGFSGKRVLWRELIR